MIDGTIGVRVVRVEKEITAMGKSDGQFLGVFEQYCEDKQVRRFFVRVIIKSFDGKYDWRLVKQDAMLLVKFHKMYVFELPMSDGRVELAYELHSKRIMHAGSH